jgi:hypothetical protein
MRVKVGDAAKLTVDDAPNGHGAKFAPFRSNLEDLAE